MESMLNLQLKILEESGILCGVSTLQDRKTVEKRFKEEGESFLTITLPSMVSDLYKALDQGYVDDFLFLPFKRKKGTKLPEFLGDFFRLLFDPSSGNVIQDAQHSTLAVDALRCIVQISGLCGKLFEQASPKRTQSALNRYLENEDRVREWELIKWREPQVRTFLMEMRFAFHAVFGDVMSQLDWAVRNELLIPSHGPGATSDKRYGNAKWKQPQWSDRLESVFPYGRWNFSSWLNYLDEVDEGHLSEPGPDIPVTVITVPKTQKTPRIIAMEPTSMQYMQQALRGVLERAFVNSQFADMLVGYKSQVPNQRLALEGSLYGDLATLDLSDASDLVSNRLVKFLMADWPHASAAIQATRSNMAMVNFPDGTSKRVQLMKFASMGSALCFPIEAMVFCTTVFKVIKEHRATTPWSTLIRELIGSVRVYGDDIIVPVEFAQSVVDGLETLGLRVNRGKSFWNGNFRESCGKEYWYGLDVTYTKLRHRLPTLQKDLMKDVESTVHTVAFRNNLFSRGWFMTAEWLDELLVKRLNGVYPEVTSTSPGLGRLVLHQPKAERMSRDLHKPLVKAYVVSSRSPINSIDGRPALTKVLYSDSELPNPDVEHLIRSGRPSALRIKQRWVSPY